MAALAIAVVSTGSGGSPSDAAAAVTTTTLRSRTPITAPPLQVNRSTFSFAVIPDTQDESYSGQVRMQRRVTWLLDNQANQDIRWVLHSGDVHSWDTPDHIQFRNMSAWISPLNGRIPYVLTVGNHDTNAVCPGGSACPGADTTAQLRNTTTWNAYYPPSRFGLTGVYQAGKSDNGYRTFTADGKQWLVMTVELWPRTAVISWASTVIRNHPNHNVIVVTHAFLTGSGTVSTYNGGYGANSPMTLWNALRVHRNVQMIFSGHVGQAATAQLTAADGHKVTAFLQAFHDRRYNPTRIVTVNTATGTVSTRIIANYDMQTGATVNIEYTQFRATVTGLRFV